MLECVYQSRNLLNKTSADVNVTKGYVKEVLAPNRKNNI